MAAMRCFAVASMWLLIGVVHAHKALLANEVPTQMVIYPNEGHGIRQPRHREDVYRRVLAWFAKYDK